MVEVLGRFADVDLDPVDFAGEPSARRGVVVADGHPDSNPMSRFPNISKYWVSCRSAAAASSNEEAMLTPSIDHRAIDWQSVSSGHPGHKRLR